MKKAIFSENELQELAALEVRGGNTASIMSQKQCSNGALGCGAGVDQEGCTNSVAGCGSTIVIAHDCKHN